MAAVKYAVPRAAWLQKVPVVGFPSGRQSFSEATALPEVTTQEVACDLRG